MEKKKGRKVMKDKEEVVHKGIVASFLCIAVFAFLVRVAVSLHPYSGAGNPPKYGDFEAQRHWMEITLNLPPKECFSFTSRGHESYLGKLLMRWTVLSSDALVFFPAVFYFVVVYYTGHTHGRKTDIAWHIAIMLLNPCLMLIDHGHFQYNCISLGLTVAAVAAVLSNKELVACFLFSLALNHKQMTAYFAPAFFSHLLGKCLRRQNPLLEVLKLGVVVLGTFALVWWPYLHSMEDILRVLSRLAPFERGIYEDYVANFWCTTSVLIKWKRMFTTESLKLFSLGATILTCLPSMVQQIWAPSSQGFLYGLMNSAFSFYMFSFQVHEKSILLPLLPASLLALEEPSLLKWITLNALFSMFPLLCRDKLILPYIALSALFILICYHVPGRGQDRKETSSFNSYMTTFLVLCSVVLHGVYLTMHPPRRYPFLFEALIMLLCFSQFMLLAFYSNSKQWMLLKHSVLMDKEKKLL
ncbi:hypothetical protein SLA2020_271880 [Shorea laevis]